MTGTVDRPLSGIRVVDAVAGPLASATRYLAELGAQVDRIAPPLSDPVADRAANLGKRIHDVDASGCEARALIGAAHIVVEDMNLRFATRDERQVVVTVSPFGRNNDYSDWQASDAVLHALSSELSRSGIRGRPPLLPPGELAWQCAAVQCAFVALQSFYLSLRSGRGDHLDFSALDGAIQALDPGYGIGGSATLGRPAHLLARGRPVGGLQYPILRCADGHVRICLLSARQWQGMFAWMGSPAAFSDPSFNKTAVRYKSPDLLPAIAAFFADRTRAELETQAVTFGVPLSGLNTLGEAAGLPHLTDRRAFRDEPVGARTMPFPNGCVVVDGQRMTPESNPDAPAPVVGAEAIEHPFDGLKVLDLGVIVVGAETGRLLADQGADVVKVESRAFPDGNRQSYLPYGLSASFAAGHRNKRSLGLDLRSARGKAVFMRLVERADVLLSNFKPRTLASLGFGDEVLAAANPKLVSVESSAFGDDGPWSARMGYGPLVRAATGLTDAWRYDDDEAGWGDSITIYPDHVAARVGAIATIALLIRRRRTGKGGRASIAQAEVMLAHFGAQIARAAVGEPSHAPRSTVYACAGDDEWCVVTERHEADRRAIDALCDGGDLTQWMASRQPRDAMTLLQAAGVPAGCMLRVSDVKSFNYVVQRGLLREERHPALPEAVTSEALQAHGAAVRAAPMRPASLAGQDSDAVLVDWLEASQGDVDDLVACGAVERVSAEELDAVAATMRGAMEDDGR